MSWPSLPWRRSRVLQGRVWLGLAVGVVAAQQGCAASAAPAPPASALRSPLPPPSAKPVPETPPPGVRLHLSGEQKRALVALLWAGQQAFARGGYDVAEHTWLEAAQLDPSNTDARLGLGRVWLLRGVAGDDAAARRKAREAFVFVLQSCPDHAQAKRLLSLLPEGGGD